MKEDKDLMEKLINQAIFALWPKVQEGDATAIDRMLHLFERKERKLKPPRRYRMSRKALQQRRAALKTGEHAKQPVGIMMRKARQAERALHERDDFEVDAEMVAIFEQAMQNDPRALRRLTAGQLAALTQLLHDELAQLQIESMAQFVPMLDADGDPLLDEDGEVILRTVTNPRSDTVLRLAKLLGVSAEDQRLTPKSWDEANLADATADIRQFMLESYKRTEAARRKK